MNQKFKDTEFLLGTSAPLLENYKKKGAIIDNKSIFKIRKEELALFFDKQNNKSPENQGESRISLNILRDCGYTQGLCRLLNTDEKSGIAGDPEDIQRRQKFFGIHYVALPKTQSFYILLSRQFENQFVIIMIWAANFYIFLSYFSNQNGVIIDLITTYSGIMLLNLVTAFINWIKERQFLSLIDDINNRKVHVYRGAYGNVQQISIKELVVGDIVDINQGDRVPADCVLLEEMNMIVDQSMYFAEEDSIQKQTSVFMESIDNHDANPDCFLYTNSNVMTGQGRALVCAVGENTFLSKSKKKDVISFEEQNTFLQLKLEKLSKNISKYAIFIALFVLLTHIAHSLFWVIYKSDKKLFSNETLLLLTKSVIIALLVLVVAIPEGLPLAVSIAIVLSINSLKKDSILIKNLESIQTCATLHDICVSKTGILTKGLLKVTRYYIQGKIHKNIEENTFKNSDKISEHLKELLIETIISNCEICLEIGQDFSSDRLPKYLPTGNTFEVGMVQFLIENEEDIQQRLFSRNRFNPKILQIPFDQVLKRQIVIREIIGNQENVRVYVKGAPEYIFPLCNLTYNIKGDIEKLDQNQKNDILKNIVVKEMACKGLKVLSYAYKDMKIEELNQMAEKIIMEDPQFLHQLEMNLTYLGTFGLEDSIREDICETVSLVRFGIESEKINKSILENGEQMKVRIISGDHLETCKFVGLASGIISQEEFDQDDVCMTGEEFRKRIGPISKIWDQQKQQYFIEFKDRQKFDQVKKKLKIISRASPEDKLVLVCGISQKGGIVGMAGHSISDGISLKRADVGICMGNGCEVAKENADLILLDSQFISIANAIRWGTTIFDNVKKFLLFQITANLSLCAFVLITGLTLAKCPFNPLQMLWINLIFDTLAAVALATEPYSRQNSKNVVQIRISRRDNIITPDLWRQIICQVVYQVIVLLFLSYYQMFGNYYQINDSVVFHCFIVMNLFNMINCQIVEPKEINIFMSLFNNKWFWIVIFFEIMAQYIMQQISFTNLGSRLLGLKPISFQQVLICLFFGTLSLLVNILSKQIQEQFFVNLHDKIGLEGENSSFYEPRIKDNQNFQYQNYSPEKDNKKIID